MIAREVTTDDIGEITLRISGHDRNSDGSLLSADKKLASYVRMEDKNSAVGKGSQK